MNRLELRTARSLAREYAQRPEISDGRLLKGLQFHLAVLPGVPRSPFWTFVLALSLEIRGHQPDLALVPR